MNKTEKQPGDWFQKNQSGDRFLMKNKKTGEERIVERDVEGIKRGDYLQPVGEERGAFLKRYGYLPKEAKKREVYNVREDKE